MCFDYGRDNIIPRETVERQLRMIIENSEEITK
jgi:hypothetical protein